MPEPGSIAIAKFLPHCYYRLRHWGALTRCGIAEFYTIAMRQAVSRLAVLLNLGLGVVLFPVMSVRAEPVVEKETVEGNLGSSTLTCMADDVYWFIDISLVAVPGETITSVAGTVYATTSGHILDFGGIVNPPNRRYNDQVQIPLNEVGPGEHSAFAAGSGTTLNTSFTILNPTCTITIE